jgi:hypothetical protein
VLDSGACVAWTARSVEAGEFELETLELGPREWVTFDVLERPACGTSGGRTADVEFEAAFDMANGPGPASTGTRPCANRSTISAAVSAMLPQSRLGGSDRSSNLAPSAVRSETSMPARVTVSLRTHCSLAEIGSSCARVSAASSH